MAFRFNRVNFAVLSKFNGASWEQGAGVIMKAIERNGVSIAGRSSRSYFSKIDSGASFTDFTTKLHVHNGP